MFTQALSMSKDIVINQHILKDAVIQGLENTFTPCVEQMLNTFEETARVVLQEYATQETSEDRIQNEKIKRLEKELEEIDKNLHELEKKFIRTMESTETNTKAIQELKKTATSAFFMILSVTVTSLITTIVSLIIKYV
jgi:hypothetical protein